MVPATDWSNTQSQVLVRAMVLARESHTGQDETSRLIVAGPPAAALTNVELLRGEGGGLLAVVDAATGETVSQVPVASAPVFDGMCAARDYVVVSLTSGAVVAFK